jgi:hypothetical protein
MEPITISLKTFTTALVAVIIIETGFRLALAGRTASSLTALGIMRCVESMVLIGIALSLEKDPAGIGFSRSKMMAGFIRGLVWSAGFGIAAGILFLVLLAAGINALEFLHSPMQISWQHTIIFFLVGGVIGPIAEEIFFRGIIYGFFRRWGAILAIIASTLIFVFVHPLGNYPPVTQLIGGIVFAIAYEREHNIMVPITIHCLGNIAIFYLTMAID